MTEVKQVQYTAQAHTTGGRDGGPSRTSDGRLDINLSVPGLAPRESASIRNSCSLLACYRLSLPTERTQRLLGLSSKRVTVDARAANETIYVSR
jgi:organic hydroperoxide reductase OsmC/OhrA